MHRHSLPLKPTINFSKIKLNKNKKSREILFQSLYSLPETYSFTGLSRNDSIPSLKIGFVTLNSPNFFKSCKVVRILQMFNAGVIKTPFRVPASLTVQVPSFFNPDILISRRIFKAPISEPSCFANFKA